MSEIPIPLTDYELVALDRLECIVRPVPVQPSEVGAVGLSELISCEFTYTSNSGKIGIFNPPYIVAPAQPGDTLVGMEDVRICQAEKGGAPIMNPPVWYMADGPCEEEDWYPSFYPAALMPLWASRWRRPVARVECKRLGEIFTVKSIIKGCRPRWDQANPGYPWDSNPWVFLTWLEGNK